MHGAAMEVTGEIDRVTIIAADFSIHVSVTDSRKRQKISEDYTFLEQHSQFI